MIRRDMFVWFPAGRRDDKHLAPAYHRTNMMQLAIPDEFLLNYGFFIDYSWVNGENKPTIEIFRQFEKNYPDSEIVWVTGSDSVAPQAQYGGKCEIEAAWTEGKLLMAEKKFLIVSRIGFPHPSTLALPAQFEWIEDTTGDIQSSYVRELISRGKPFENLVPDAVAKYIKHHHLYGFEEGW